MTKGRSIFLYFSEEGPDGVSFLLCRFTDSQLGFLFSAYALPNIVAVFFAGVRHGPTYHCAGREVTF